MKDFFSNVKFLKANQAAKGYFNGMAENHKKHMEEYTASQKAHLERVTNAQVAMLGQLLDTQKSQADLNRGKLISIEGPSINNVGN